MEVIEVRKGVDSRGREVLLAVLSDGSEAPIVYHEGVAMVGGDSVDLRSLEAAYDRYNNA